MALIDKELIFDITNGTNRYIVAKANDSTGSRAFIFKIVNDNKPFSIKNLLVKVTGKKADGKDVVIDAEIVDVNNSIIKFDVTTQMQTAAGVLDLELLFLKDSVVLSSIPFKVGVIDSARDNKEIESSNEYGSFTKGLVKLDEWDKIFKETSNKIEEKYTERLNQVDSQLAQKMEMGGEIVISQININKGKFDQSYLTEELLQQMAGNTPITAIPGENSVTTEKLANNSVTPDKMEDGVTFTNLYRYPTNCIDGSYINTNGDIENSIHAAYAKINVIGCSQITIFKESERYAVSSGQTLLFDKEFNMIEKIDASQYISGTYRGKDIVTIPIREECGFLCFNVRLVDYDDRHNVIVMKGNEIAQLGIEKLFNNYIIDKYVRNKVDEFIGSIKSTLKNLYNYTSDYIPDKYVNMDGEIASSKGWGYARIKVNPKSYVSILMHSGIYDNSIGKIGFYDKNLNLLNSIGGTTCINGYYKDTPYITLEVPESCQYVFITCKRSSTSNSFDDSVNLICVEGEVINDYIIENNLLEIRGCKVNPVYHKLKDKKWICVGDSLTEHNIRATKNYHDYVKEYTGINVINLGKSGTGYKRQEENNNAFYQRVKNIPVDADIITIFGSGNDLGLISKLGEVTDTTTDTICGCINKTIEEIYRIKIDAKIGIITPCPWGSYNTSNVGNSMDLYSQKLVAICKRRGIPCLDLYHESNMRPWDEEFKNLFYKRDAGNNVHPDEDGHYFMFNKFLNFIESL